MVVGGGGGGGWRHLDSELRTKVVRRRQRLVECVDEGNIYRFSVRGLADPRTGDRDIYIYI